MNPVAYICQNRRQGIPALLPPQTKAYQSYIILYNQPIYYYTKMFASIMRKGIYVRAALPFACAAMLLTGCTTPGETDTQYIRLSDAACSFQGADNRPVTVEVHANPAEWKAEASASWVTISDVTATSLTVEVIDNDTEGTREAEITVTSGAAEAAIRIVQVAKDYVFPRYRCHPEFQYGTAMSPSGRYAGGFYWEYDDESNLNCYPVVIDVATGEWTELGPYPQTLFSLFSTSCISDYGDLVIATENDGNVMFRLDGSYEEFKTPAGFTSNPQISQVAADGTWVGWCGKDGTSYPVKWVDGVTVELPKPALNYRDEPIGDVQARGISADGRIVYGTTWDNFDFGMVYWDEAGEVHYVGEDVRYVRTVDRPDGYGGTRKYNLADGMWTTATNTNVSPNGKYIAGTFRRESMDETGQVNETNYPAFFNTETGKTVIFEELVGGGGVSATSDGLGFTVDNTFGPNSGKVVDIENGIVLGSALEWIESTYGILVPAGYITYMPDSKDRFLGAMLYTGGPVVEGINWYVGPAR